MNDRLDDSVQLSSLYLSGRTANCMSNSDIKTVGQVRAMTDAQLLDIVGFGRGSLREIRHVTEQRMAFMAASSAEVEAARVMELRSALVTLEGEVDRLMTRLGAVVDAYRKSKMARR